MKLGLQLSTGAEKDPTVLLRWLLAALNQIREHIDGAWLGFGDGTNTDNIRGCWYTYTTNAVANTDDVITHNLGIVPVGQIIVKRDKPGILYTGAVAWTVTTMSLKCNVASMEVLIFVLAPSNQFP